MTPAPLVEARTSTILFGLAAGQREAGRYGIWLLPANVCVAVPLALLSAGAEIEFVDIDPVTLCLDVTLVKAVTERSPVAGVVYVRTYGVDDPAADDLANLRAILGPDAVLVDDRCLCDPETEAERMLADAEATLFSTGYGKPLDLGGGCAFLNRRLPYLPPVFPHDPDAYRRLEELCRAAAASGKPIGEGDPAKQRALIAAHGPWLPRGGGGPNWPTLKRRIDDALPAMRARRQVINDVYTTALGACAPLRDGYHGWRFNLRAGNSAEIVEHIFAEDLFASRHYVSAARIFGGTLAPVAERLATEVVNLFNDRHFDKEKAARVAAIVTACYRPTAPLGEII